MQNTEMNSPDPQKIKAMFSEVAGKYDLANSVLSLGIHHLWRRQLTHWSDVRPGQKVLDCATGTGDLAILFKQLVQPNGEVVGTDFCAEMLETAPQKAREKNLEIKFEIADVMHLPYEDNYFDIVSISFGIRNVANPLVAIQEMARVCKPGGRVMILEFGQIQFAGISSLYNFYAQNILPKIGGLVTGKKDAYEYLQKSSAKFPSQEKFVQLMKQEESFASVEYQNLSLGIANLYKGIKNS